MTKETEDKAIKLFGLIATGIGAYLLYHSIPYLGLQLWTGFKAGFKNLSDLEFLIPIVIILAVNIALIVSGIGVIKRKAWARYYLLSSVIYFFPVVIARFLIIGPYGDWNYYISWLCLSTAFLWFFNKKSIKDLFNFPKHSLLSHYIASGFLSLAFVILFGLLWIKMGGHKMQVIHNMDYSLQITRINSHDYYRTPFPVNISIMTPNDFTVVLTGKDVLTDMDKNNIFIWMRNPQKALISFGNGNAVLQSIKDNFYVGLYDDLSAYAFAKKFYNERFGVMFLLPKIMFGKSYHVEEIKIRNLDGFMVISNDPDERYHLAIFHEKEPVATLEISPQGGISPEQINAIISSIQVNDAPIKSEQEYFQAHLAHWIKIITNKQKGK